LGPFIAHDYPTLIGAAIQGVGLAQAPGPLTASPVSAGRLQALRTPVAVTKPGIFLYYPGRRQVLPKLRAFIDHVKSRSNVANKTRIHVDDRGARPRKRIAQGDAPPNVERQKLPCTPDVAFGVINGNQPNSTLCWLSSQKRT
jgi:hypothetical protein